MLWKLSKYITDFSARLVSVYNLTKLETMKGLVEHLT
jgi:hypothetical protein